MRWCSSSSLQNSQALSLVEISLDVLSLVSRLSYFDFSLSFSFSISLNLYISLSRTRAFSLYWSAFVVESTAVGCRTRNRMRAGIYNTKSLSPRPYVSLQYPRKDHNITVLIGYMQPAPRGIKLLRNFNVKRQILTIAVRDEFITGLMVRQVNVYVTTDWWAHATLSTK